MRRLIDRLRWSRTGEGELDDEIRAHLEIEAERIVAEQGLSPEAARDAARRAFGNLLLAREDSRAVWSFARLESWLQDVRFGLRLLVRAPLFTTVAVASLALGIGASVASFSLVNTVLLRPLPVPSPDDLLLARWVSPRDKDILPSSVNGWLDLDENGRNSSTSFSYRAYVHLRDQQASFEHLFAFSELDRLALGRDGGDTELATGQYVSGNYFRGLGIRSIAGRVLDEGDDRADAEGAAVISYKAWQQRFGGSPSVVGTRITLNNAPFTIVGVTPRGFHGCLQVGLDPDFSIAVAMQPRVTPADGDGLTDAGYWWMQVMGRLRGGTPPERATSELTQLFTRHATLLVEAHTQRAKVAMPTLLLSPGRQGLVERRHELASPLTLVAALVCLVLLVASANVAGLLLSRASARTRELAMRMALGARRLRLVRQMITESVMLSLAAGAIGLLLATWFVPLLLSAAQPRASQVVEVSYRLDSTVALFAGALSLATGILLGLLPALRGTRLDVSLAVKERVGVAGPGRSGLRLGKMLVVAQIALSLLLVALAGLFAGTLRNLHRVDTGVNAENVLAFRVEPGLLGYEGPRLQNLYNGIIDRIAALPGVRSVGLSRNPLFAGSSSITTVKVPGAPATAGANLLASSGVPLAWLHVIGGRYLETLETPLVSGRRLDHRDGAESPRVVLVNQEFARRFFPSMDAVGRTFVLGSDKDRPVQVVGVVGDARYTGLRDDAPPTVYVPATQRAAALRMATLYVKTSARPEELVPAIRRIVREADPQLGLLDVSTLLDRIHRSTTPERRVALTSTLFALLAVLLSSIGLYGLMACAVSRRTGEIGVRLAMGASPRQVVFGILRETSVVVGVGVLAGVAAALEAGRLVSAQLFGVEPTDAATVSAAAAAVAAIALAAGFIPARRASRVDPVIALRTD